MLLWPRYIPLHTNQSALVTNDKDTKVDAGQMYGKTNNLSKSPSLAVWCNNIAKNGRAAGTGEHGCDVSVLTSNLVSYGEL